MPRYWFLAKNEEFNLLELQRNAFVLNWKRRDSKEPSFAGHLRLVFHKYFSIFENFLRKDVGIEDISVSGCELNYMYVIRPCEYWRDSRDTANVVPSFQIPETGEERDALDWANSGYTYILGNDLQLRVAIRHFMKNDEPEESRLILEITSRTVQQAHFNESESDAWFARANDAISACFVSMTSGKIQREHWKLVEEIS